MIQIMFNQITNEQSSTLYESFINSYFKIERPRKMKEKKFEKIKEELQKNIIKFLKYLNECEIENDNKEYCPKHEETSANKFYEETIKLHRTIDKQIKKLYRGKFNLEKDKEIIEKLKIVNKLQEILFDLSFNDY